MNSSISNSESFSLAARVRHAILALLMLCTCIGASALLNRLDPYPQPARAITEASASLGIHTRLLAIGASHILNGINPSILGPDAMNLTVNAGDYRALWLILRNRLVDMPNLEIVLLEADNLCLFNTGWDRRDFSDLYVWGLSRADLPLPFWVRLRQTFVEQPLVAPFFFSNPLTPVELFRIHKKVDSTYCSPGFQNLPGQVTAANNGPTLIRNHELMISDALATDNLAALTKMLRGLRLKNIKVVLITTPHQAGYTANASILWKASFKNLLNIAQSELGDDMVWWNYDGHPAFNDADFFDGHHLNGCGAAKFSKMLRERLGGLDW